MKSDEIKELAELIKREISYDASGHSPEERCPHCGQVIKEAATWGWWIDHKGMLAQAIANHLGLGARMREGHGSDNVGGVAKLANAHDWESCGF